MSNASTVFAGLIAGGLIAGAVYFRPDHGSDVTCLTAPVPSDDRTQLSTTWFPNFIINTDGTTQTAIKIAQSLKDHPGEWSSDGRVVSRGSVFIWIASGKDYISVGRSRGEAASSDGDSNWVPSDQDKELIWNAYYAWTGRGPLHAEDIHP